MHTNERNVRLSAVVEWFFTDGMTSLSNDDVTGGIPEVGGGDWSGCGSDKSGTVLCGDGREPASPSRRWCETTDVIITWYLTLHAPTSTTNISPLNGTTETLLKPNCILYCKLLPNPAMQHYTTFSFTLCTVLIIVHRAYKFTFCYALLTLLFLFPIFILFAYSLRPFYDANRYFQ